MSQSKSKIEKMKSRKGQSWISFKLSTKILIYSSIVALFLIYQFNIISLINISFNLYTLIFIPLGFVWTLFLSSYKTGHVLGYSLSRKATSRAILYLLVVTFFIVYQLFISENISLIFAASCCSATTCVYHNCYCDLTDACSPDTICAIVQYNYCMEPDCYICCTSDTCNERAPTYVCAGGASTWTISDDCGAVSTACVLDTTPSNEGKCWRDKTYSATNGCDASANCHGCYPGDKVCSSNVHIGTCSSPVIACAYSADGDGKCDSSGQCAGTSGACNANANCGECPASQPKCDANSVQTGECSSTCAWSTTGSGTCESTGCGCNANANCDECSASQPKCDANSVQTGECSSTCAWSTTGSGTCESTGCSCSANANCDELAVGGDCRNCYDYCSGAVLWEYDADDSSYNNVLEYGHMECSASCGCAACPSAGSEACDTECGANANCEGDPSGWVVCSGGTESVICCTTSGDGNCQANCNEGTAASSSCDENSVNTCGNGAPPAGYCSTCTIQTAETSANGCRCISCGTDNSAAPGSCDANSEQGGTQDPWNTTWTGDTSGIKCCGNDASEYPTFRNCTTGVCTSNTSDLGCCSLATKCVYSGTCYANGNTADVDGDSWIEKCRGGSSGQWVDGGPPRFFFNNSNTTTPGVGDPVLIYANWTDDVGLGLAWLWTNETGGSGKNWTSGSYGPIDINLTGTQTWSNFTWQNSSVAGGTVVAWKIYANDTAGNENVTGQMTFTVQPSWLEVSLIEPISSYTTSIKQNDSLTVNATVYCRVGQCGNVYGTARYNGSSANPDTPINTTKGDKPFYNVSGLILQSCPTNPLDANEFCNLTWTINATGDYIKSWQIGVLFNSSRSDVTQNHTFNATIKILECLEDVSLSWNSIDFSTLIPTTQYNKAPGNDDNLYNITNTGSCTMRVWIKGTDLQNPSLPSIIGVGNISWSNTTSVSTNSYNMAKGYVILNSSFTTNIPNITTYYWLSVPAVWAGRYNGTITICWNTSQQSGMVDNCV